MNRLISEVPIRERQKRMAVFTKSRQVVLVKFLAMGALFSLREENNKKVEWINPAANLDRDSEARMRGLDPNAYRSKGDIGFCLFQKESVVSIAGLLEQLQALGLKYGGGHWKRVKGKGIVSTLHFSTLEEAIPLPKNVREMLKKTFRNCTVWCNLRYAAEGGGQFRLDTINLAKPIGAAQVSRRLVVQGNTYRLV